MNHKLQTRYIFESSSESDKTEVLAGQIITASTSSCKLEAGMARKLIDKYLECEEVELPSPISFTKDSQFMLSDTSFTQSALSVDKLRHL